MAGIILTADIGTSSLKAAFIDLDGQLLAFSRMPYRLDSKGNIDAGAWKHAFVNTVKHLHTQVKTCVIDGICISGNGPTLVPVTQEGILCLRFTGTRPEQFNNRYHSRL